MKKPSSSISKLKRRARASGKKNKSLAGNHLFLGPKALGELRILIRLATPAQLPPVVPPDSEAA